jgi:hypothetical protein
VVRPNRHFANSPINIGGTMAKKNTEAPNQTLHGLLRIIRRGSSFSPDKAPGLTGGAFPKE